MLYQKTVMSVDRRGIRGRGGPVLFEVKFLWKAFLWERKGFLADGEKKKEKSVSERGMWATRLDVSSLSISVSPLGTFLVVSLPRRSSWFSHRVGLRSIPPRRLQPRRPSHNNFCTGSL